MARPSGASLAAGIDGSARRAARRRRWSARPASRRNSGSMRSPRSSCFRHGSARVGSDLEAAGGHREAVASWQLGVAQKPGDMAGAGAPRLNDHIMSYIFICSAIWPHLAAKIWAPERSQQEMILTLQVRLTALTAPLFFYQGRDTHHICQNGCPHEGWFPRGHPARVQGAHAACAAALSPCQQAPAESSAPIVRTVCAAAARWARCLPLDPVAPLRPLPAPASPLAALPAPRGGAPHRQGRQEL